MSVLLVLTAPGKHGTCCCCCSRLVMLDLSQVHGLCVSLSWSTWAITLSQGLLCELLYYGPVYQPAFTISESDLAEAS